MLRVLAFAAFAALAAADIYSCGGYVRTTVPIDYSKLQIKLFSSEGHLKQEEDVNSHTGYYMVPVYNKGKYTLKVSAPSGYYFEPNAREINIDGILDPCTTNEDINFSLTALDLHGLVESPQGPGPSGLELILLRNNNEIARVLTSTGGSYTFRAAPGNYEVTTAKNSEVCIERGRVKVKLTSGPIHVSPPLRISGYPLEILIQNNGSPMEHTQLKLYSKHEISLPNCEPISSPPIGPFAAKYVCTLPDTNQNGLSILKCTPPGSYFIEPSHKKQGITYHFEPEFITINVENKAIKAQSQVSGFSVIGRVEHNDEGIADVDILRDNQKIARTDSEGYYIIQHLQEGQLQLSARYKHTTFSEVQMIITFDDPHIPKIYVTGFALCGRVEQSPDGSGFERIALTGKRSEVVAPNNAGSFCLSLPPGLYDLGPATPASSLTPRKTTVDLTKGPVLDVVFYHFKTNVDVKINCIGECPKNTIELMRSGSVIASQEGDSSISFKDVAPGEYNLRITGNSLICWKEAELTLLVERLKPKPVTFVQSGFIAKVSLSHPATLKWKYFEDDKIAGVLEGVGSVNEFCVPAQGMYNVEIVSCKTFAPQKIQLKVPSTEIARAEAVDALITGKVLSKENADIVLQINSAAGTRSVVVKDGTFSFKEPIQNGKIVLVPQSSMFLFEPQSFSLNFYGECIENAAEFKADKGIFVNGVIEPSVEKVLVSGVLKKDKNVQFTTLTDKNGKYRIGPVRKESDLVIQPEMDGYSFVAVEGKFGHFHSTRLSKLTVRVGEVDKPDSQLEDVLLSVVGSKDYRSNQLMKKDGTINFVGLAPGDYYVRPILQEFKFEPSQTTVKISEGEHVELDLKGRRVTWSAFGSLRYMSGDSYSGATIEALSTQECDNHQSEGLTQEDGSFRIRGLKPACHYVVKMKLDANGNPNSQSFPSEYLVNMIEEHVTALEFVVTPRDSTFEFIASLDASDLSNAPQAIKYTVYDNEEVIKTGYVMGPQTILNVANLTQDGRVYTLKIDAEKPSNLFKSKTVEIKSATNAEIINIRLADAVKQNDVEISFSSLLSLPFFSAVLYIFIHQQKCMDFLHDNILRHIHMRTARRR